MNRTAERHLIELYNSFRDSGGPFAVPSNGIDRKIIFDSEDFTLPAGSQERYRHFDLADFFGTEKQLAVVPPAESSEIGDKIFLRNGFCNRHGKLTTRQDGLVYGSLSAAFQDMPDSADRFDALASKAGDITAGINTAFFRDGLFIHIPQDARIDRPTEIIIEYDSSERGTIIFPRILVLADKGSKADFYISHCVTDNSSVSILSVREIFIDQGADITINESVDINGESRLISNVYTRQTDNSKFSSLQLFFDYGQFRVNSVTDLDGRECESNLHALYFGDGRQVADFDIRMNHNMPECTSDQQVKSVVSGNAQGAFTGRVYVAPDAQKTMAYQQSRNLQLSDTSRIYTEPQLEIYADDVKCSHGATVGQMDDEALYYMRQRGISETDARKLQLYGFVNDIISRCRNEEICSRLARRAEQRISEL